MMNEGQLMVRKLISMMKERRIALKAAMVTLHHESPLWEEMCQAHALFGSVLIWAPPISSTPSTPQLSQLGPP